MRSSIRLRVYLSDTNETSFFLREHRMVGKGCCIDHGSMIVVFIVSNQTYDSGQLVLTQNYPPRIFLDKVGSIVPLVKPLDIRKLESSSYQALRACFNPYKAFLRSLHCRKKPPFVSPEKLFCCFRHSGVCVEDIQSEALATLILNKLRAGIKVCAIKAHGFGENRKSNLHDLATLNRGEVTVLKDDTVVLDVPGEKKAFGERCEQWWLLLVARGCRFSGRDAMRSPEYLLTKLSGVDSEEAEHDMKRKLRLDKCYFDSLIKVPRGHGEGFVRKSGCFGSRTQTRSENKQRELWWVGSRVMDQIRLTKPLDEPEREFQRRRKAALRSHQNESLVIAGRNLFDDEASSSYNTGAIPPTPPKTLHEHSHPNSFGFLNLIAFPTE
ncbi:putative reverse transcriptase domain-containing protein [Tanacetum coccineum]